MVTPVDHESRTAAPALQRGLAMLELVGQSPEPVAFGAIQRRLDLPKASTARLLGCLRDGGYLEKDPASGRYRLGSRAALLAGVATLSQRLAVLGEPMLRRLRDRTGNSAILLRLADGRATCLARAEAESAVPMQPPGTVKLDLGRSPWGLIYFDALDKPQQRKAEAHIVKPGLFAQLRRTARPWWPAQGFAYDDQLVVRHVRRLAAPVHHRGQLVAAVALGGNPLTIADDAVGPLGRELVAAADDLGRQLDGGVQEAAR